MTDWQPIETAPALGRILAIDPARDYCAVVVRDGPEWAICNEHGTSLGIGFYPTHWMPLPAAPIEARQGQDREAGLGSREREMPPK